MRVRGRSECGDEQYGHALIAPDGQNTKFIGELIGAMDTNSTTAGKAAETVGATATAPGGATTYPFEVPAYTVVYDPAATGPTKYMVLDAWTGDGNTPAERTFVSYADGGECIWRLETGYTHPTINYGYNGE